MNETDSSNQVMGPSSPSGRGGPDDAMDQDSDAEGMKESAVNRQTALLSLDVLARVLGRRHQVAFEGVLGDVTEIVAGVGSGALPGELCQYCRRPLVSTRIYLVTDGVALLAVIQKYRERLGNETKHMKPDVGARYRTFTIADDVCFAPMERFPSQIRATQSRSAGCTSCTSRLLISSFFFCLAPRTALQCFLAVGQPGSDGILPLRASAFLLVATLCAVLGVRAFTRLPSFFPAMLEALEFQKPSTEAVTESAAGVGGRGGGRSLLWTSALSAVATVAASLPSFLSPYLGRILAVALRPASAGAGSSGGPSAAGSKQAADRVLSLLATGVEARLLVPAVCGAYAGCVEGVKAGEDEGVGAAARAIARLLAYVQEVREKVREARVVGGRDTWDDSSFSFQFHRVR